MKNRFLLFLLTCVYAVQAQNYAQLVNPFIGTGGHGHTFPGATAPFGMVQLSPDTRLSGWDGCSGYHYSDSAIYGFSHTHLSGTGCSDFGDVLIMPTQKKYTQQEQLFDAEFYKSGFSHATEKAFAGFYQVLLNDDQIAVKLTASERVGFHEYQFQKAGTVNVILDLLHRDELLDSKLTQVNNTTITGLRRSKAWAEDQWVYFRIEFSKPFKSTFTNHKNNSKFPTGMAFEFDVKKKETIQVKVSLSSVDEAGASKNMQAEIPAWSFDKTLQLTTQKWNKELGLIQVEGNTKSNQQLFYTALYHCFIQPNIASDIDGRYRGRDLQIHQTDGFTYYSVFSLWDTFRAAHPLYNLVQTARSNDFIRTFLQQFKEGGKLPVWELASNETNCMIGYHSASVIADAWAKGIRNYDKQLVIAALLQSANANERGIGVYKNKGYLAIDDESESVSKTLEYAYDDWCIAQFLEDELQLQFNKRAESWKNLFDPSTGNMRPRKNGGWLYPFDPKEVNNHFTEANSWQYSFFVPHDINGLIARHGSAEKFEQKLDELFNTNSQTTGRTQADITGLIGQYAHGNEPSHHMAWLYNYVGKPAKTQAMQRKILTSMYQNAPDGLAGNEDCGQMSAWFVFNSMGLYPVCPGKTTYDIGTPFFDKITIRTGAYSSFTINAAGAAQKAFTLTKTLNGNALNGQFIEHESILKGGQLNFQLQVSDPQIQHAPIAKSKPNGIFPAPIVQAAKENFKDSLLISMESLEIPARLFYKLSNEKTMHPYLKPFYIHQDLEVSCIAVDETGKRVSKTIANFKKIKNNWQVVSESKYNPQYTAGGEDGLIDGMFGSTDWRKGYWQGFQGHDFECVIDLKKVQTIKKVKINTLQDTRSWIVFPSKVTVEIGTDSIQFKPLGSAETSVGIEDLTVQIQNYQVNANSIDNKARYIRIKANQFGKLPEWHQGNGNDSFIFIDEIEVE